MAKVYLQRIASAVPENDIHRQFVDFAANMLHDRRARSIFERLEAKSDIRHRYSCLHANRGSGPESTDAWRFYGSGRFPTTAERMKLFEQCAPVLAAKALDRLMVSNEERRRIRHVLVTVDRADLPGAPTIIKILSFACHSLTSEAVHGYRIPVRTSNVDRSR